MSEPQYKRVLLKISGEALAGDARRGLDFDVIGKVCDVVKQCVEKGIEVAIVVGGGNFWRGMKDGGDRMQRVRADHMGMLATTINALAVPTASSSVTLRFGYRPPLRCALLPSRTSARRPAVIWKRAVWSFSAAEPATRISPPTPVRHCGRLRSTPT